MTGALVAIAVLIAASTFGLVRRRRDGRLRTVGDPSAVSEPEPKVSVPSGESGTAGASGRTGISAPPNASNVSNAGRSSRPSRTVLDASDIGEALGERATLVQFSSAFCAPCRATRRILGEVVHMVDGVVHVEIDAEQHLDLVRRLNILRTPTVLVLDGAGRIIRRASGQPRKADVIAALGQASL